MPIHDIYSNREERLRKGSQDIYTYDELPKKLRVQIVHILNDVIGKDKEVGRYWAEDGFKHIHDILKREYGVFYISNAKDASDRGHILTAILDDSDVNKVLSIVEESLRYAEEYIVPTYEDDYIHLRYRNNVDYNLSLSEAVDDLNKRFKESTVGYQYEGSNIIRIDSTYIHSEIVLPTINLLNNQIFVGANSEYLAAHKHYREDEIKNA